MTFTHNDIIQAVCYTFALKPEDLYGSVNNKRIVALPRNIALMLLHRYTYLTKDVIGVLFGIKHPTVSIALNKFKTHMEVYREVREKYELTERNLIHLKQHSIDTNHANANQD